MSSTFLQLTAQDPLIARDARPFGANQAQRMRSLDWLLPSVVAGSFRTALVKAHPKLDFTGDMPQRLKQIEVAGVFPVYDQSLYLPAPNDAVAQPMESESGIQTIHRAKPQEGLRGGCDLPAGLLPVMLPEGTGEFKPAELPTWWPTEKYLEWLVEPELQSTETWLNESFLCKAQQVFRDHVALDPERGAAAESMLFTTVGLSMAYMPRFGSEHRSKKLSLSQKFAEVTLAARVKLSNPHSDFEHINDLNLLHPLGGERRLAHWKRTNGAHLWECPDKVKQSLTGAKKVRMILTTPAIFEGGWRPGWLNEKLEGKPPGTEVTLKLVGMTNGRWKAVSGWSLAPPRGPKPTRRMVPAGSAYFFDVVAGEPSQLADVWLESVSDDPQERRDGFGLVVWGMR